MREWFKKYLGWLGLGTLMFGTLIVIVDEFILKTTIEIFWVFSSAGRTNME